MTASLPILVRRNERGKCAPNEGGALKPPLAASRCPNYDADVFGTIREEGRKLT